MRKLQVYIILLTKITIASVMLITSCTPVNISRLPERRLLTYNSLPNLEPGWARIYFYLGYGTFNDGIKTNKQKWEGIDGNVFINDIFVSYINEHAIVVDVLPGSYSFNWKINDLPGKELHKSVKLQLSVNENEILYFEANSIDLKNASLLGVFGGVLGSALEEAKADSNIRWSDVLVSQELEGHAKTKQMSFGEYVKFE